MTGRPKSSTGPPSLSAKDFNFWRIVGRYKVAQMFSWDLVLALVLAVGGCWLYTSHVPDVTLQQALMTDFIQAASALFGVVLAGAAIVAAFFGGAYARLIADAGKSPLDMLRHFVFVAGLTVACLTTCIGFKAFAVPLEHRWVTGERYLLGVCWFLFFWALFASIELMKLILGVAQTSFVAAVRETKTDGKNPGAASSPESGSNAEGGGK